MLRKNLVHCLFERREEKIFCLLHAIYIQQKIPEHINPIYQYIFLPCYQLIYFKYKTRRITILVAKALNITGHQRVIVSSCIIVSWTGNTPPDKENLFFTQTG